MKRIYRREFFVFLPLVLLLIAVQFLHEPVKNDISKDSVARKIRGNLYLPDVIIAEDYHQLSRQAVGLFVGELTEVLERKEAAVVMLPTGGTYLASGGFYDILVREYKDALDWSRVMFFNLDEYVGLSAQDERSYNYQLRRAVTEPLGVPEENIFFFRGDAQDLEQECRRREELIVRFGGVDITLLGIGVNGHIAFNEPGSTAESRTRRVPLSQKTKEHNARYFSEAERVPDTAVTVGIATILDSARIFLLANGASKKEAVARAISGEAPLSNPVSFLHRHPNVVFILDQQAANKK